MTLGHFPMLTNPPGDKVSQLGVERGISRVLLGKSKQLKKQVRRRASGLQSRETEASWENSPRPQDPWALHSPNLHWGSEEGLGFGAVIREPTEIMHKVSFMSTHPFSEKKVHSFYHIFPAKSEQPLHQNSFPIGQVAPLPVTAVCLTGASFNSVKFISSVNKRGHQGGTRHTLGPKQTPSLCSSGIHCN